MLEIIARSASLILPVKALLLLPVLLLPAYGNQAAFLRKAEQWMASTEASKRQAAYRSWLQMGPDAMPKYEEALEDSRDFHEGAIDKLCSGSRNQPNPYADHDLAADELESERERVIPLIRTDWKKDSKKIAMLRNEMEDLESLFEKVAKTAGVETGTFDRAVDGHLEALFEVRRELERFDDDADSKELSDDELRSLVLEDHLEAAHLRKLQRRFQRTRDAIDAHNAAEKANAEAPRWASAPMKDFATTLNHERLILGLGPFRLEEKLSDAAKGHSKDMASLGFFAHESPVPGKKTPWDRARKAGFQGNASGENIYMGSTDPQAAYHAWFASDGHRFIMMASGPNVLGVGISGKHWTMMTGKQ